MRNLFLFISLSLFIITSCGEDSTGIKYGTISGTVLNGIDSTLISNVEISTVPATTVLLTDKDGKFFISNVIGNEYTITASKIGYQKRSVKVNVIEDKTTKVTILMFPFDSTKDTTNPNYEIYNKSSLVCYYPFDNSCNNMSKNKLHGINKNTSFEKDINNSFVRLYGNKESYVLMNYPQQFNLNEFTYSFWVKPLENYGTDYQDFIDVISRWGNWTPGFQSFTFALNKKGSFKSILFSFNEEYTYTDTKNVVNFGVWTHIAISYKNSNVSVFINGQFKETFASIKPANSTEYGIKIGTRYDSIYDSSYNGYFDDLTVFSEALSNTDIQSLYDLQADDKK